MQSLEQKTITSMEVAEMVEKNHKNVLRDIKRYVEQFDELKIEPVDFFSESTYRDSKGEERPCYLVTKKGCEFIAHKMTGVKGTQFTAKYINRFHEMEDAITENKPLSALEQLQIMQKATLEVNEKVDRVAISLQEFKDDAPLFGAESDELSAHVKRKGVELLGGKSSEAYRDNTIRQRVFRFIYNQIKNEYDLYDDDGKPKSYKALKRKYLADVHELVDCCTLSEVLKEVVNNANAQMNMCI